MGKHFVTVCVFCLLCATHTPCSSHVQLSTNELKSGLSSAEPLNLPIKNNEVFQKITDRYSPTTTIENDKNDDDDDKLSKNSNELHFETNSLSSNLMKNNTIKLNKRSKRDIRNKNHQQQPHHHHTNMLNHNNNNINNNVNLNNNININETEYIEKIFTLFGNGETINQDGFERLIKTLHLDELLWSKINNTSVNLSPVKVNANGIQNDTNTTCMDHRNLIKSTTNLQQKDKDNTTIDIDYNSFNRLCPILMYQMVAPSSAERRGCIKVVTTVFNANANANFDPLNHVDQLSDSLYTSGLSNTASVWLYATLSIIIISACGLLGVLVIPIMQQHFYHHLIQFLVALAVGTLAGDALLHLLPHAMMPHTHHDHQNESELEEMEDQHERNMWRGFVAMIGLIFFFFMEKCLTLCAEWRKQRQLKKNKVPIKVRVMRETDAASSTSVGCKHKYSSYPYCYGVIATETQDDHHTHPQTQLQQNDATHNTQSTILNDGDSESEVFAKNHNAHSHQETNSNLSKCTVNTKSMKCSESNKMLADNADTHTLQDFVSPKNEISESESYTVILRTHENKHHGHSHTHGHVHSAPKSMSSVAWMVVMGDGLHNFTDGMAIGAAFAGSLAGGFSTAVAVFCHELPHEIGDFAVLLKAGMTARQAIFYNMLSSLLCLFGMILGVFLGNNDAASSWIFACAAGMFLYIALVDMIPELTTSHSKEGGSFLQCILQFFGLIMGLGLMLVIALYEHDLKLLFHD